MLALPDAGAIWIRARSAIAAAQYPVRIDYTIAVSGLDGSRPTSERFRASCDPSAGAIRIFPIGDQELAQPPAVPHGVNFAFSGALSEGRNSPAIVAIPAGRPAPSADLLGEPLLSPTYMFGLRYAAPASAATPGTENSLRVIAVVSAQAPAYRVALIDTPSIDGVETYHLKLTPLRKPKDNRLRELWVGSTDYLPRRAVIAGNFTAAPLVDVPWTVDFSIVGGAPYIARESAISTLYLAHERVVSDASVSFEDIHEPSVPLYDEPLVEPAVTQTTLIEPQN